MQLTLAVFADFSCLRLSFVSFLLRSRIARRRSSINASFPFAFAPRPFLNAAIRACSFSRSAFAPPACIGTISGSSA